MSLPGEESSVPPRQRLPLALDAMGGDLCPKAAVEGACLAAEAGIPILLVGRSERLERELRRISRRPGGLELVDAPEVVEMDEPASSVRRRRDSSLARCAQLVHEGRAAAMVSAGNTGAVMIAAKLWIGATPGVDRPALAATFPNRHGRTVVLDVGANVSCRPEHLRQFAVMGHAYAVEVIGVTEPRIGLLSIGEEAGKGDGRTREAFQTLAHTGLNFVGNVEGRDVFNGFVDVVVCDGFVGNVLLKAAEGMAELVLGMLREELARSGRARVGAWLVQPAFESLARRTDYAELGAVPLLGVEGGCFVAHGRSNAKAFASALKRAAEYCAADLHLKIKDQIAELHRHEARLADSATA